MPVDKITIAPLINDRKFVCVSCKGETYDEASGYYVATTNGHEYGPLCPECFFEEMISQEA